MNVLKNSSDYQNFYKILFYPLKIDSYMEQHKIYEIVGELLLRIGTDQPSNDEIIDFMIANLCKLNEHFNKKPSMKIEFLNCTADSMKYLKKLSSKFQIPIIYENSPDSATVPKNHPKIICDFKDNSSDDKLMIISTADDIDNNNSNQDKSPDCNLKLKKAIEMKLCYNNLKYVIQNARLRKPLKHTHGKWNHRVLMVGRMGSGRKTQVSQLAKEFGLVLIDLEAMIKEYEQQCACAGGFWSFVQETLLKPQCLHNGYVIVSNVISRMDLLMLMEKFIHEPNKIIFIHTNENKCRRRILKQKGIYHDNNTNVDSSSSTSTSQTTLSSSTSTSLACGENVNLYLDYQMNLYNLHKKDFLRYFASTKDLRQKIYHVNGNGSVNDIKSWIWAYFCDK
ncbi:uncharacterized protein [Chironomus tepperi]|uniref:uncharacterized protein n=1 Tax=Chironomus tepperi TaxID=113505 RepID=UPI00391F649F